MKVEAEGMDWSIRGPELIARATDFRRERMVNALYQSW
jgi:hypothetical protein